MGLMLFRDDLRCVDIERVVDAFVAEQQTPKTLPFTCCSPTKPPLSFAPMRRSQSPVASLLGISFN